LQPLQDRIAARRAGQCGHGERGAHLGRRRLQQQLLGGDLLDACVSDVLQPRLLLRPVSVELLDAGELFG